MPGKRSWPLPRGNPYVSLVCFGEYLVNALRYARPRRRRARSRRSRRPASDRTGRLAGRRRRQTHRSPWV
ncbi:hypothetical protein FRACA_50060 [Frankia canadensis]|uniref:Uncharacterized protein n=1 Tax=Frankia canadensis TaxID=1836972 RepID=A0A2I2KYC3_9ACTN|nr:hypothetical protein FRACA_50060 [Frankia canadensis]SOU57962.1 hypothetical protein FRACA_50060 [Frankia canadensis]